MKRPLVIYDMDETLLHTTYAPEDAAATCVCDFLWVHRRPHLETLLRAVGEHYDQAVWSAGSSDYVPAAVAVAVAPHTPLTFAWSRDHCTLRRDLEEDSWYNTKPLHKVRRRGWGLDRVLIVEDTPENVKRNYGNAIYVRPFFGDAEDDELMHLTQFLIALKDTPDFRRVDKRGWRHRVEAT